MEKVVVIKPEQVMGDGWKIFFNGEGLVKIFFKSERLTMAQFELLPGKSLNEDVHPDGDEGYYIAAGICTVILPELNEIYEVHEGELFYIPAGVRHIAMNAHGSPAKVIAAIAPQA